jgi:hypothetical protein
VRLPPTLTRVGDVRQRETGDREHVHRFRHGLAHAADLLGGAQSRRVEDICAGVLERPEAGDRVAEIGIAADVVLGSRCQRERKAKPARRLCRRRDPLDRVVQLIDLTGWVVVLDRGADRAHLGDARDRVRRALRIRAVAVLEVHRHRQLRCPIHGSSVRHHLVKSDPAVEAAEREREPGAGGGERLEPERGQHPGGAGVPRIGDHERRTGVQRLELRGLRLLPVHGCNPADRHNCLTAPPRSPTTAR